MSIPYIKKDDHGILTLYVDDKPFFCRSGEIHNSNASDPGFMDEKVWPRPPYEQRDCSRLLGTSGAGGRKL